MSLYHKTDSLPRRFRLILASFLQRPGLAFVDVVSEQSINRAFEEAGVSFADDEDTVYTPAITLWAFLSQVLFKAEQRSCAAAVARVAVLLVALKKEPCSGNTGAYCRARAKLCERAIRQVVVDVADGCEKQVDDEWLWHGRHVYLADGTTVSMPDTPENQAKYPQQPQQREGLGFPIARLLVLLSLSTGMIKDAKMGTYSGKETGETALLRQLLDRFEPGDILLADRLYCSYFMVILLRERGIDFVTRVHQRRKVNFRRGRRLGQGDHIVTWQRPQRPSWMDEETYVRMPASLTVREIQVRVNQPGFRVKSLVVLTTLEDAKTYTQSDIGELYYQRWLVELDIRAIKGTLGLDILRCKTPHMIHNELWTGFLAYNLIRQTMLQSARASHRSPRQLSFTAGIQAIAASWTTIVVCEDEVSGRLSDAAFSTMGDHVVGLRPGRVEPRAVKRRPKEQALLMLPRPEARAALGAARSS